MIRKILWISAVAAAAVVLVAVVAGVLLYFFFPQEWAGRKASEAARTALPGWKISVGRIAPVPLGRFSAGPFHAESPKREIVFDLDRIAVRYEVRKLLSGSVRVTDVALEHPRLHLGPGLDKLFPKPEKEPPGLFSNVDFQTVPLPDLGREISRVLVQNFGKTPSVEVERFAVSRFTLIYDDGRTHAELPPVDLEASLALTPQKRGARLAVSVPPGSPLKVTARDSTGRTAELSATAGFTLKADWPGDETARLEFKSRVSDLVAAVGNARGRYADLGASATFTADLASTSLDLTGPDVSLPGFFAFTHHLQIRKGGTEGLEFRSSLKIPPQKSVDPLVRFALAAIPNLRALPQAEADVVLTGKLTEKTLRALGKSADHSRLPLDLDFRLKAAARDLPATLLPEGVSLRSLEVEFSARAGGQTGVLKSTVFARGVSVPTRLTGGTALPALSVRHSGEVALTDLRHLEFKNILFRVDPLGVRFSLHGTIESALPFPELQKSLENSKLPVRVARENFQADLTALLAIRPDAGVPLRDVEWSGAAAVGLRLLKDRVDRVRLGIDLNVEDLSLGMKNGLRLEKLNLRLPVEKTLSLGGEPPPSAPEARAVKKPSFDDLRPLSPFQNALTLGRFQNDKLSVENVRADLAFDGSNLLIPRLTADLLGGSIWAKMTALPMADHLDLDLALEVVGIDVAKLSDRAVEGDSKISADARAQLALGTDAAVTAEGILDELAAQFHLTKIGDRTLDRLLVALDPNGENPSFVQARGLLKESFVASALKNPEVSFRVSHGILDADLRLPNVKMVDLSVPIRGISVKDLMRLAGVRKSVEGFLPLLKTARFLTAAGIDDRGKLVFRSPR